MHIDSCTFPCIDALEKRLSLRSFHQEEENTLQSAAQHRDINDIPYINTSNRATCFKQRNDHQIQSKACFSHVSWRSIVKET